MTNAIDPTQESSINQADYLQLFMQELAYQDPLKPVDNREFMAQMAQFSALQQAQTTNETLSVLAGTMNGNQSLMLLGKKVTIRNSEKEGRVYKIEFPPNSAPKIHLIMDGSPNTTVDLAEITSVLG